MIEVKRERRAVYKGREVKECWAESLLLSRSMAGILVMFSLMPFIVETFSLSGHQAAKEGSWSPPRPRPVAGIQRTFVN